MRRRHQIPRLLAMGITACLLGMQVLCAQIYFNKHYNWIPGTPVEYQPLIIPLDTHYIVVPINSAYDFEIISLSLEGELQWRKHYKIANHELRRVSVWSSGILRCDDGSLAITAHLLPRTPSKIGRQIPALIKFNENGDTLWTRTYRVGANQQVLGATVTDDGGFMMTGWIGDAGLVPVTGSDWKDMLMLKVDSTGAVEWYDSLSHPDRQVWEEAYTVQQMPDGGYLFGGNRQYGGYRPMMVRTDSRGRLIRWKLFGVNSDDRQNIGCYYIGGDTVLLAGYRESIHRDYYREDMYLANVDTFGNIRWEYYDGGDYSDGFGEPHVMADGSIVIAASDQEIWSYRNLIYKFKSDGHKMWVKEYYPPAPGHSGTAYHMMPTPDKGFVLAGYARYVQWEIWVMKIDSNGCEEPRCGGVGAEMQAAAISISFYPNPSSGQVRIAGDAVYPVSVALHSTDGRRVMAATLRSANEALDVSALPAGIYLAQGEDALGRSVRAKVVVE